MLTDFVKAASMAAITFFVEIATLFIYAIAIGGDPILPEYSQNMALIGQYALLFYFPMLVTGILALVRKSFFYRVSVQFISLSFLNYLILQFRESTSVILLLSLIVSALSTSVYHSWANRG
jgi:hypothetical protein